MKLRQENPDLLELCHTVPMEVIMAGEGTGQAAGGWGWQGGRGFAFSASEGLGENPDMVITASALILSFPCLPSQRSSSLTLSTRITMLPSRTGCSVTWCLA